MRGAARLATVFSLISGFAIAQSAVVDGYVDCDRATNGRAYCKRVGKGDNYFPVSDDFLARYRSAAQALAQKSPTPVTNVTVVVNRLRSDAAETRGMIELFNAIIIEQRKIVASSPPDLSDVSQQAIAILQSRVRELQKEFTEQTTQLGQYLTSIKPNDPDTQISPRKASELFPKVPFYIPGTPETGEFWMEPTVSDTGQLLFNLKFIDPKSENDKIRDTIGLTDSQLDSTQKALARIVRWSKIAHDNHIRREITRRATCFPEANCPENGGKRDGVASTEIDFKVYEDGSTAGRIQRNKGRYEDGYNLSIDSALLLQAYFNHVLTEGRADYGTGTKSDEEVKDLFK